MEWHNKSTEWYNCTGHFYVWNQKPFSIVAEMYRKNGIEITYYQPHRNFSFKLMNTENNNTVKYKKSNSTKPLLDAILSSADLFENVECNIDGKIKLMNEYRILVEPNSKADKELYRLLYGN